MNSVAAEYAFISRDRCPCGGAWEKLGRVSDYNQLPRFVTDHFRLRCQACGREERLDFRVDVHSPEYEARGLYDGQDTH